MAGFGSIQKELKKKKKKKKEKRKNTTKLSVLFFKKREKIRPQKQLKDYNVTEKEL